MGKEAIYLLNKSLEIIPNHYSSLVDMVIANHMYNNKDKVISSFNKLKEIYPNSYVINYFSNIILKY